MQNAPDDLLSQFELVRTQARWLGCKWDLFSELFWRYPKRQQLYLQSDDLMYCFRFIFEALHDDILMGLCRLGDPAKAHGQENLTFQRLLDHPAWRKKGRLDRRLRTLQKLLDDTRKHRHKRVGHSDLAVSLGQQALPKIGKSLPKAVKSALALSDAIEQELERTDATPRRSLGRDAACALLRQLCIAARCEKKALHEAAR